MRPRDRHFAYSLAFSEILAVLILVGCASLPGRPGPGPEVIRPDEVLDFNTLYKQNCSGCHGTEGRGGAAVSIGDPVYQALVDDAALHRIITDGLPGTLMPLPSNTRSGWLSISCRMLSRTMAMRCSSSEIPLRCKLSDSRMQI